MIYRINEIKRALENDLPEAAMALTLTLPDICGLVENPNEMVGKRYIDWLKNHVSPDAFDSNYDGMLTEINGGTDPKFSKLSPQAIYKLRCHFLHSGDSNIQNEEAVEDMDYFVLKKIGADDFTDKNGIGVSSGFTCYIERDDSGAEIKHYEISVDYFCKTIIEAAEKFYDEYPNKRAFDDHVVRIVG